MKRLRSSMLSRGDQLLTSTLTVGEVLVVPTGRGNADVIERYLTFFRSPRISLVSFDLKAASLYARIRQDRSIPRPDAVQLACAAAAGTDLFLTNDLRLSQKVVPGIQFITSLERAPI